ncbi:MAG: ion transporter [Verrucomicrobiales bacterium]
MRERQPKKPPNAPINQDADPARAERQSLGADRPTLRHRLRIVIFGTETRAGRAFDVVLLGLILSSVAVVMLESVEEINQKYRDLLWGLEIVFTALFTIEYVARLWCIQRPLHYALSFFGLIDLLSILPTYVELFMGSETHYLLVIRIFRLLRMFRIFKMARHLGEAHVILAALRASRAKITVFLFGVLSLAIMLGTIMYIVEGKANGFTSIPRSIYWSIITITTVGYGDIAPKTPLGQFVASLGMIMAYAIIAVPTGIVGVEIQRQMKARDDGRAKSGGGGGRVCEYCGEEGHAPHARFCLYCGEKLRGG